MLLYNLLLLETALAAVAVPARWAAGTTQTVQLSLPPAQALLPARIEQFTVVNSLGTTIGSWCSSQTSLSCAIAMPASALNDSMTVLVFYDQCGTDAACLNLPPLIQTSDPFAVIGTGAATSPSPSPSVAPVTSTAAARVTLVARPVVSSAPSAQPTLANTVSDSTAGKSAIGLPMALVLGIMGGAVALAIIGIFLFRKSSLAPSKQFKGRLADMTEGPLPPPKVASLKSYANETVAYPTTQQFVATDYHEQNGYFYADQSQAGQYSRRNYRDHSGSQGSHGSLERQDSPESHNTIVNSRDAAGSEHSPVS